MSKKWLLAAVAVASLLVIGFAALTSSDRPRNTEVKPKEPDQDVLARAAAGDPQAQLQVGNWSLEKAIRPEDYRQAAMWLRKAAESGNPEAQCRLGMLYQSGRVTDGGNTNALFWYQKAAAQSHVTALYNLGMAYGTGQGVTRDDRAAARFLRQAAQLGDPYAQFNMGRRCAEGQGIATNLVEAWQWFALAESGGITSAREPKHAVEARLTTAELEQAKRAAEAIRKQLAAAQK